MAGDAVPQVDAPEQAGRRPIGAVRQAGEQAAETADDDAEGEGADKHPAGRAANALDRLIDLHRHDRADQSADDAVRERRTRADHGVERPRHPGAARRSDRQGHEITPLDLCRDLLDGRPKPPAIECGAHGQARRPRRQIEHGMRPGRGGDVDHAWRRSRWSVWQPGLACRTVAPFCRLVIAPPRPTSPRSSGASGIIDYQGHVGHGLLALGAGPD